MKSIFSLFALLLLLIPTSLSAQPFSEIIKTDQYTAQLVANNTTVGANKTVWLGLDLKLAPGWHTYWKLPGEAGEPPHIDWSGSSNLESAELLYPAPIRIETPLSDIIGYEDHVIFPIKVTLKEAGLPLAAMASVDLFLCKEICVPANFKLNLRVEAGALKTAHHESLLAGALAKVPTANEEHGLKISKTSRLNDGLSLNVITEKALDDPDLFIDNPEGILFSRPTKSFSPCKKRVTFKTKLLEPLPAGLSMATLPITVTVVDGTRMLSENIPNYDANKNKLDYGLILLFALLGGLILNLMPCVLPVLSLKIMSAIKHHGKEDSHIRSSFLATSAGIVCSFLALAVLTIILKYTGHIFGWGAHFQQPLFIVFMTILLTLFAANMWGLFHINLPRWLLDKITHDAAPRLAGDFSTGIFATLLATPCTAPFLGTAVGFALASGTKDILYIFTLMGIGMALPFILISIKPSIANLLPKPGKWMTTLSKILAIGLAGTATWLLYVLNNQIGLTVTAIVAFCLFIIVILTFFYKQNLLKKYYIPALVIIISLCFIFVSASDEKVAVKRLETQWSLFEESKIDAAIQNGKVVFVDITADWCLNCKFNKAFILSQDAVRKKLFKNRNVIALQGDWTKPDPKLTNFLQKNGRYGIPFNAVFGPSAPNGILLPEILSASDIFEAIEKAR